MLAQVHDLDIHVGTGLCLLQHPLRRLVGEACWPGGSDDKGDAGIGGHDVLIFVLHGKLEASWSAWFTARICSGPEPCQASSASAVIAPPPRRSGSSRQL